MYIGHVSDCFLPRLGGIEWQVHDLAVRQQAAGHRVEVVTAVPGDGTLPGIPVHRPGARPDGESIHYLAARRGCELAVQRGFDVIHVHASTFAPLAYLTARAAGRAGIPTALTVHSLWSYATPLFRLAEHGLRWSRWPVAWSAVSTVAAVPLQRLLPAGTAVTVLPNGVDRAQWTIAPAPRDRDDVHVVSVLRFSHRKRPLALLDQLQAVRRRVPDGIRFRATLVGDGPLLPAVREALHARGMTDWVQLTGRLDRPEIAALFARADLYLAPADLESFGIAALEARCAGLPVIGKRHTGLRDFIADGVDGLLGTTDADLVEALLTLTTDAPRRATIAQHNRARPPRVSWQGILETCSGLYGAAAARAAVPHPGHEASPDRVPEPAVSA